MTTKRMVIGSRIRKLRRALKGHLTGATRLRLTQELTQRLGEHAQLGKDIQELGQPTTDIGAGAGVSDVGGADTSGGDPNQALIDSNAALQAAIDAQVQAEKEHTAAIAALKDEINKQNAISSTTVAIGLREAQRALADMISNQLGGYQGAGGRALTAGAGRTARY